MYWTSTGPHDSGCGTILNQNISSQSQQVSMEVTSSPLDLSSEAYANHQPYWIRKSVNEDFEAMTTNCSVDSGDQQHQHMLSDVLYNSRANLEALQSLANEVCCSIAVQEEALKPSWQDQPQEFPASNSAYHAMKSYELDRSNGFSYNIDNPYLQGATIPFPHNFQLSASTSQMILPAPEYQNFQLLYPLVPVSPCSETNTITNLPMLNPEEAKLSCLETLNHFHAMTRMEDVGFGQIVNNTAVQSQVVAASSSSQLSCDSTSQIDEEWSRKAESLINKKFVTEALLSNSTAEFDNQAEEEVVIKISIPSTSTPTRRTVPPTPSTPITKRSLAQVLSKPLKSVNPLILSKPKTIDLKNVAAVEPSSSRLPLDEMQIGRSPCKSASKIPPYEIAEEEVIGPHCSILGLSRSNITRDDVNGGVKLPCSQLTNGVAKELAAHLREIRVPRKELLRLLPRLFDIEPLDFENDHLVKRFHERLIKPLSPPSQPEVELPRTRSSSGSNDLRFNKRSTKATGTKSTENMDQMRAELESKQFVVPEDVINIPPSQPRPTPKQLKLDPDLEMYELPSRESKHRESKPRVSKPRGTKPRKPTQGELLKQYEARLEYQERCNANLLCYAARSQSKIKALELKVEQLVTKRIKKMQRRGRKFNSVQNCKCPSFICLNFEYQNIIIGICNFLGKTM